MRRFKYGLHQESSDSLIGLLPLERYGVEDVYGPKHEQFRDTAEHEIGHCLGIGMGMSPFTSQDWYSLVRYEYGWWYGEEREVPCDDGKVIEGHTCVRFEKEWGNIKPHFIGETAGREFQRLTKNQWGDHPYVPLEWWRFIEADPSHLSGPLFQRSSLGMWAEYGNYRFVDVSRIEAAILADLGYSIDFSMTRDIRLVAGFRPVSTRWGADGMETLFYPDFPLDFTMGDDDYESYRPLGGPFSFRGDGYPYLDEVIWDNVYWFPPLPAAKSIVMKKRNQPKRWCGVGRHPYSIERNAP